MDLFTHESTIKIIRITSFDVNLKTDIYFKFIASINEHESMYPQISTWVKNKVLPEIVSGKRIAYLGIDNDLPIATAILKVGSSSKFCHLHIKESYTNKNLGDIFFTLMALDIRHIAKEVYFTLPEHLWADKSDFFKSFSFNLVSKAKTQYRAGEEELYSSTDIVSLIDAVKGKIPKIRQLHLRVDDDLQNGLILSVQPKYAKIIMAGKKTIEVRRVFNKSFLNRTIVIYSSKPDQQLLGTARISNIYCNTPDKIYNDFSDSIGVTREEFNIYTEGCLQVYGIRLSDINPFAIPIPISHLNGLLKSDLNPPQSYSLINNNDDWADAVTLSQLIFNKMSTYKFFA